MKKGLTYWYSRQLLYFLPILIVALQGCGLLSANIELKKDVSDAKIAVIETGSEGFVNNVTSSLNFRSATSKVSDTSFVMGIRLEPEQGVLRFYNNNLNIQWSTTFFLDEDENQPFVWYWNGKVTILTKLYERDILTFIGRQFDCGDGTLLSKKEIAKISLEKFDDDHNHYYMAPDSSHMLLVMNTGAYEETEVNKDMKAFNTLLITVPHDLSSVQKKDISILIPRSHADYNLPGFAINNQGDVYYPFYNINEKNMALSVVRLSAKDSRRSDTLSFLAPVYYYRNNEAHPGKVLLQMVSNDVVALVWEQMYKDETACISVGRFDFAAHRVPMHTNITFTEEEIEKLVDEDELDDIRMLQCMPLLGGDMLLVFDQQKMVTATRTSQKAVRSRGANGQINTTYRPNTRSQGSYTRSGPLIAVRLGSDGVVQWKNALSTRSDEHLVGASFENYPSLHLTDKSLQLLYRTRSTAEGITFMEFLLNDGSIRTAKLPVTYSNFALLLPRLTQWTSDTTVTLIGSVGEHGRIVKIKLPATEAYSKE